MNMEITMLMWFSGVSPDNMRPAPHPDGNYSPSTYNCGRAFIREGNDSDSGTRVHTGCKGRLFLSSGIAQGFTGTCSTGFSGCVGLRGRGYIYIYICANIHNPSSPSSCTVTHNSGFRICWFRAVGKAFQDR